MPSLDASFEEPLLELRKRIEELEDYPPGSGHEREVERLKLTLRRDQMLCVHADEAGTWGPREAETLLAQDRCVWRTR